MLCTQRLQWISAYDISVKVLVFPSILSNTPWYGVRSAVHGPESKAVNREDKRSRRYRDRDFAKFERSRRYRDR